MSTPIPDLFLVEGNTSTHTLTLWGNGGTNPDLTTATFTVRALSETTGTTSTLSASNGTATGTVDVLFTVIQAIAATSEVRYQVEIDVVDGGETVTYPSAESDPRRGDVFIAVVRPLK